jgi:hypothetical protein
MNETDGCVLLYKAQELARSKGFDVSLVACALLGFCDGTSCLLIEQDKVKISRQWEIMMERKAKLNERK